MHKRFLLEQLGWEMKWDSAGKVLSTLQVHNKEQVEPIPSWGTFLSYWNHNFPKMRIQLPREDTCGQCHTFANSFRFKKRKHADGEEEGAIDNESSDDGGDGGRGNEDATLRDAAACANKRLVLEATKHVRMAKFQRDLHNVKKQEALAKPDQVRTHAIDCAQNTMMPHFGDEQPW